MSRLSHRRETEEGRSPWRIEAAAVSDRAAEPPPETDLDKLRQGKTW